MNRVIKAAIALVFLGSSASAATINAEFWDASRGFSTIEQAINYTSANAATATFQSTAIDYPNRGRTVRSGKTSLASFIGSDAASILGNGSATLGYSVFRFTGRLDLTAGTYKFSVGSDDGFRLFLDGKNVTEQIRPRRFRMTKQDVAVTGDSDFELYYVENRGSTGVKFKINGDIVDTNDLATVPVPASLPLLAIGLIGLGLMARRRKG